MTASLFLFRPSEAGNVVSLLHWDINPRLRTAVDWIDEAEHRSKPLSRAQTEKLYDGSNLQAAYASFVPQQTHLNL
jgi:hypothetical protein